MILTAVVEVVEVVVVEVVVVEVEVVARKLGEVVRKLVEVAVRKLPVLEPSVGHNLEAFQPDISSPRRRTPSACIPASPRRSTPCPGTSLVSSLCT